MRALSRTSTADYTLREFLLHGNRSGFTESRRIYHYHFQVPVIAIIIYEMLTHIKKKNKLIALY